MLNKFEKAERFLVKAVAFCNRFLTPEKIFGFLCLFWIFQVIFSLCFNVQLYRDVGGVYAWYAREFGNGIWWDVPLSKVPVLNVFLGGLMDRCGLDPYSSIIILALVFLGLTLVPLYKLLKLFLPAVPAAWGCVFLMLSPKVLRFSGCGLLESTRDFFLVSALYLLFKSWSRNCKWYHWALFGVSLGFLSLARGEGIVMAGAVAAGLFFRKATQWRNVGGFLKTILLPTVISGVAALCIMSPVLIQNYKVTGFPVTDARMIGVLRAVPGVDKCFTLKLKKVENDPRVLPHAESETSRDDDSKKLQKLLPEFFGNVARGAYEPYLILAGLGIVLLIKRKQWRGEYSFLVGYCLLVPFSFINFAFAHRYFVFFIPMLMVFTLYGVISILSAAEKYHAKNILLSAGVVVLLLQPLNAWLWMVDDAHKDELGLRDFIMKNRRRFLPEGEKRKLIIHADSRLLYRCGEDRLFHYGEALPDVKYITGFDLLLVLKKEQGQLTACQARHDLRQIEAPFRRFVIFAPVERNRK